MHDPHNPPCASCFSGPLSRKSGAQPHATAARAARHRWPSGPVHVCLGFNNVQDPVLYKLQFEITVPQYIFQMCLTSTHPLTCACSQLRNTHAHATQEIDSRNRRQSFTNQDRLPAITMVHQGSSWPKVNAETAFQNIRHCQLAGRWHRAQAARSSSPCIRMYPSHTHCAFPC